MVLDGVGEAGLGVPRGAVAPAAAVSSGGGAPVAWGGGGGVGELQGEVVERFQGSVWTKGDRRWELRGSRATAAMGCRGGSVPEALGGGERAGRDP